jgi:hypothetical protein
VFWHSYIESFQNVKGALILFLHRTRLPHPPKKFLLHRCSAKKKLLQKRFRTKEKAAKHCHRCSRGEGAKRDFVLKA